MSDQTDNKHTYLNTEIVKEFVAYLAKLLNGRAPLNFMYSFGTKGLPADYQTRFELEGVARTFEDLFARYFWDGQYYEGNAQGLRARQAALRSALAADPVLVPTILHEIAQVMDWGLPKPAAEDNMHWARLNKHRLPFALWSGMEELQAEQPNYLVFATAPGVVIQPHGRVRMNAGYTKVYSLLTDGIIIYDSRVGAALCWLVRQFLRSVGHAGQVPDELSFLWSPGHAGVNRNPSGNGYRFGKLGANGRQWAQANVRASWILETARLASSAEWCSDEEGLRKVECALFMLGYKLPLAEGESYLLKATTARRPRTDPIKAESMSSNHIAFSEARGFFDITELIALVQANGGYIRIGSTHLEPERDTLEHWLRNKAGGTRTMQATPKLYGELIATGMFRLERRRWPFRQRDSNGLVLVGDGRWPEVG